MASFEPHENIYQPANNIEFEDAMEDAYSTLELNPFSSVPLERLCEISKDEASIKILQQNLEQHGPSSNTVVNLVHKFSSCTD